MKEAISALVIGIIFGFGLALAAGMLNPAKVQGFLISPAFGIRLLPLSWSAVLV